MAVLQPFEFQLAHGQYTLGTVGVPEEPGGCPGGHAGVIEA